MSIQIIIKAKIIIFLFKILNNNLKKTFESNLLKKLEKNIS